MSEEKPNFKVTDRRLFNSDGSPREGVVREEPKPEEDVPPASAAPPPARPESARSGAGNQRAAESPSGEAASPARPARGGDDARAERRDAEQQQQQQQPQQSQPGAAEADPTPFANLVMFIASPAAAAMGMTEHPGLAPGEIDLPLAKHCIDLLATVGEKTRGNLSAQEQQIVDGLLAELRMQYVSLTSTTRPAAAPRGFTGGDITGGR